MVYIIMADGLGLRWNNHSDTPKHLIQVDGMTLLARTTMLLRKYSPDCEIIITTHNSRYETEGAVLYEPKNNVLEIDRFTSELIDDNVCFLYGDTYYSEHAIERIVRCEAEDILFFGTEKSIVGIKVKDGNLFRHHVDRVRDLYLKGEINQCIGWQVYLSFCGLPLDKKQLAQKFVLIQDWTKDFNTPEDLTEFAKTCDNVQ